MFDEKLMAIGKNQAQIFDTSLLFANPQIALLYACTLALSALAASSFTVNRGCSSALSPEGAMSVSHLAIYGLLGATFGIFMKLFGPLSALAILAVGHFFRFRSVEEHSTHSLLLMVSAAVGLLTGLQLWPFAIALFLGAHICFHLCATSKYRVDLGIPANNIAELATEFEAFCNENRASFALQRCNAGTSRLVYIVQSSRSNFFAAGSHLMQSFLRRHPDSTCEMRRIS